MATLALRSVRKEYGKLVALDGLDLEVGDGEFFVLLGPSGAGKTTTLKCVAGLETPTAGRVEIGGRDVTDAEPNTRHVAMAFENSRSIPNTASMTTSPSRCAPSATTGRRQRPGASSSG